jgi:hypothetical protein
MAGLSNEFLKIDKGFLTEKSLDFLSNRATNPYYPSFLLRTGINSIALAAGDASLCTSVFLDGQWHHLRALHHGSDLSTLFHRNFVPKISVGRADKPSALTPGSSVSPRKKTPAYQ